MSTLFRNSSPGALTLEQAIELELKRLRARRRAKQQAESAPEQGDDFTSAEDAVPEEPDENHRDLWTHTPGTLFRNDSPGALTLDQAVEIEQKRMAARRKAKEQTEQAAQKPAEQDDDFTRPPGGILGGFNPRRNREYLASFGRGEDTEVAHVARGELVVPRAMQSPVVLSFLRHAAAVHGIPFERLSVGNPKNSVNPATGAPEFGLFDGWGDQVSGAIDSISRMFGANTPENQQASTNDPSSGNGQFPESANYMPPEPGIGTMRMPTTPESGRGPNAPGFGQFTGPAGEVYRLPRQAEAWPGNGNKMINDLFNAPRDKGPHEGLDLQNRLGQPAYAAFDGQVDAVGKDSGGRNYIGWRDNFGNYHKYIHTGPAQDITQGTKFAAGDIIGVSDGSGVGPDQAHLHWEVRPGSLEFPAGPSSPLADPQSYLQSYPYKIKPGAFRWP